MKDVGNYKKLFETKEKAIDTICRLFVYLGGFFLIWYFTGKMLGML